METLANSIFDFVKNNGPTTLLELSNQTAQNKGDFRIVPRHGLIMWEGVTQDFCEALNHLLEAKKIEWETCSPLLYLLDGGSMNLPIANSFRDYKKERWFPVVIKAL